MTLAAWVLVAAVQAQTAPDGGVEGPPVAAPAAAGPGPAEGFRVGAAAAVPRREPEAPVSVPAPPPTVDPIARLDALDTLLSVNLVATTVLGLLGIAGTLLVRRTLQERPAATPERERHELHDDLARMAGTLETLRIALVTLDGKLVGLRGVAESTTRAAAGVETILAEIRRANEEVSSTEVVRTATPLLPAPPPRTMQEVGTELSEKLGARFRTSEGAARLYSEVDGSERFVLASAVRDGGSWRLASRTEGKPTAFVLHDGRRGFLLPNNPRFGSMDGDYRLANRDAAIPSTEIERVLELASGTVEGDLYRTTTPGQLAVV